MAFYAPCSLPGAQRTSSQPHVPSPTHSSSIQKEFFLLGGFFARWILENTKKPQRRRKKGTEKAFSSVLHLLSLLRGFRFPDLSFFPSFSFSKEGSVINFDI